MSFNKRYKKQGLTARQHDYHVARRRMVEHQLRNIRDARVLDAMAKIPRHLFVEEGLWEQAYGDCPLPIGDGQTISQPLIVAQMSQSLGLQGHERVLEIGTGCGYQTAILCELAKEVFSIERIARLSHRARRNLYDLSIVNFKLRVGDGTLGWCEEAPFDAVLVAAGGPQLPPHLRDQLVDGGRLVVPIGSEFAQELVRVTKHGNKFDQECLGACRFVKLIGSGGWQESG